MIAHVRLRLDDSMIDSHDQHNIRLFYDGYTCVLQILEDFIIDIANNITAAGAVDREFLSIFFGFFGPALV